MVGEAPTEPAPGVRPSGDGLEFSVLGSGSSGNCVLVRGGGATVLVDAGLSLKETRARMASLDLDADDLDAVFITHEHADHVAHAGVLGRNLDATVFLGDGTRDASARLFKGEEDVAPVFARTTIRVGGLKITAVKKPHDAAEPVAFLICGGDATLGIFTDLGHVDDMVADAISQCTLLVYEANHDPNLLARGPYPHSLKRRVGGALGHMSNEDAARGLARCLPSHLRSLVLAHLSSKNNHPTFVRDAFVRHLGEDCDFPRWISYQRRATPLFDGSGAIVRKPAVAEPAGEAVSA